MIAPPPPPPDLSLTAKHVAPAKAYVAGPPVRIAFRFTAPAPPYFDVEIVRRRSGKVVRRFTWVAAPLGRTYRMNWDGLSSRGRNLPDARYVVQVRQHGRAPLRLGSFVMHGHKYPIRGPHFRRGGIDYFGAPRNGGRIHEGFDIGSPCGTPVGAARGGTVRRSFYDPVLYGHLVIIRGAASRREYWYSHLAHRSRFRPGQRIKTGEHLGVVGDTGNARGTGCHLHFEIRSRGRPIDPFSELRAWDRWS